jgi:transposase
MSDLPEDSEALRAMVRSLLEERDLQQRRIEEQHVENLRLQQELERVKKLYYGPRADSLRSSELAQLLLNFAEQLDREPVQPEDVPPSGKPDKELRWVKLRKGRRNLANFENLPVTTHIHELTEQERGCPCCGVERKQVGSEESWQVEYLPGHFMRIHHIRAKYACAQCESQGENPQMATALSRIP